MAKTETMKAVAEELNNILGLEDEAGNPGIDVSLPPKKLMEKIREATELIEEPDLEELSEETVRFLEENGLLSFRQRSAEPEPEPEESEETEETETETEETETEPQKPQKQKKQKPQKEKPRREGSYTRFDSVAETIRSIGWPKTPSDVHDVSKKADELYVKRGGGNSNQRESLCATKKFMNAVAAFKRYE